MNTAIRISYSDKRLASQGTKLLSQLSEDFRQTSCQPFGDLINPDVEGIDGWYNFEKIINVMHYDITGFWLISEDFKVVMPLRRQKLVVMRPGISDANLHRPPRCSHPL